MADIITQMTSRVTTPMTVPAMPPASKPERAEAVLTEPTVVVVCADDDDDEGSAVDAESPASYRTMLLRITN